MKKKIKTRNFNIEQLKKLINIKPIIKTKENMKCE